MQVLQLLVQLCLQEAGRVEGLSSLERLFYCQDIECLDSRHALYCDHTPEELQKFAPVCFLQRPQIREKKALFA